MKDYELIDLAMKDAILFYEEYIEVYRDSYTGVVPAKIEKQYRGYIKQMRAYMKRQKAKRTTTN